MNTLGIGGRATTTAQNQPSSGDLEQQLFIPRLGVTALAAQPVETNVGRNPQAEGAEAAVVEPLPAAKNLYEHVVHGIQRLFLVSKQTAAPTEH